MSLSAITWRERSSQLAPGGWEIRGELGNRFVEHLVSPSMWQELNGSWRHSLRTAIRAKIESQLWREYHRARGLPRVEGNVIYIDHEQQYALWKHRSSRFFPGLTLNDVDRWSPDALMSIGLSWDEIRDLFGSGARIEVVG